jgi:putative aldouronate transport system permease protein
MQMLTIQNVSNCLGKKIKRINTKQIMLCMTSGLIGIIYFLPILYLFSSSISSETSLIKYGMTVFPREISFEGYAKAFKSLLVLQNLGVSFFITIVGSVLSLIVTVLFAYPLSRKHFPFAGILIFLFFATTILGGGIIPQLNIMIKLNLMDNLWSLILVSLINPFNIVMMRNYFMRIPKEIEDVASIDGANFFQKLWYIILPLSSAGIITILLFYMLTKYNEWFYAILFISSPEKYPIQVLIRTLFQSQSSEIIGDVVQPTLSYKNAVLFLSIIPIMMAFPFAQKYFKKGMMAGSLK